MVSILEEDIIKQWRYDDQIYVSLICMTFNQKDYIQQTVLGFLSQSTEYKFEIIIHDDASNDGTSEIIESYQNMYPNIIRIIQQTSNQYSLKRTLPTFLTLNKTKGKYVAICEGDDYWNSASKIQQQVTTLENNPDINLCWHANDILYDDGKLVSPENQNGSISYVSFEDAVINGGDFMCTATLMFRGHVVRKLPDFFLDAPVGDYFLQVITSAVNGSVYINQSMSTYRKASKGSWSSSVANYLEERNSQILNSMLESIRLLALNLKVDNFSGFDKARSHEYCVFAQKALFSGDSQSFYRLINLSWLNYKFLSKRQVMLYVLKRFPRVLLFINRLRHAL